jgi:hypothetical protein
VSFEYIDQGCPAGKMLHVAVSRFVQPTRYPSIPEHVFRLSAVENRQWVSSKKAL